MYTLQPIDYRGRNTNKESRSHKKRKKQTDTKTKTRTKTIRDMNYWEMPDEITYCRTCDTETNGETYCCRDCYNYDLE